MSNMTTHQLGEAVISEVGVEARSIDISSTGDETILRRGATEVKARIRLRSWAQNYC